MIDPQDLKRCDSNRQIVEIGDKVRHQLGRIAKQKGT
jgi:hypothetical protein